MKAKLNDPVSKAHSEQFERFVLAVLKVRTSSFYVKNWQYEAFVLRIESEYPNFSNCQLLVNKAVGFLL